MSKSSCVACIPPAGPQADQVTPPLYGGGGTFIIVIVMWGGIAHIALKHRVHIIVHLVMRDFKYRENGCCYLTVDPETCASEKGICLTQQMCHTMSLFHNGCAINR